VDLSRRAVPTRSERRPRRIDDIGAQVDQVAENTLAALTTAGAGSDDVLRTVIYVVSDSQTVLADVWTRFTASVIAPAFTTASTLLGVTQLGFPGQRVELDVTAICGARQ
jgi:enamine deaminase RidA (YjgF/YER057c/UK114 family)